MKYIASLSFGKDSMAMLLEIIKRKLPLDYVIYCDIKYSNEISGEHPVMAKWIPEAEKILKDKFGIEVIHLSFEKTFVEQFYTVKQRGKHIGDIYGFPLTIGAWCNDRLKMRPINDFFKSILRTGETITQYIGIAQDEPERLERYKECQSASHKYVTLADFGITENEALEICKEYGLLSPIYGEHYRGGCWFCPKQCLRDLWELYTKYPTYFNLLEDLEKDSPIPFRANKTLAQIKQEFQNGKIPVNKKMKGVP